MTHADDDVRGFDLNLVRPLLALLHERHVSRAAVQVHLTQPAMSRALARLRRFFGDELLVRVGAGYELTARAGALLAELSTALPALDRALVGEPFDPARSDRSFRITAADSTATFLGPGLVRRIRRLAPSSTVALHRWHDAVLEDLDRGRSDLVLRAVAAPAALRSGPLLSSRFVCVVNPHHPLAGRERLTLADYLGHRHVSVDLAEGEQPSIDRRLSALVLRREVVLTAPDHAVALAVAGETDLVATLPAPYLDAVHPRPPVRVCAAPAELRTIDWSMIWHPRADADPAQQWLREQLRAVASEVPAT